LRSNQRFITGSNGFFLIEDAPQERFWWRILEKLDVSAATLFHRLYVQYVVHTMTDVGTNIPARPASDRKHKKYEKMEDNNTSAALSVASSTSSQHVSSGLSMVF
jgi:hypothetical protein